ncbi:MAG: efflux transporter outer membrane subunit [Bacteroidales bacterium]|nr:efflux transporter outer membrane subunit [Bacteroidales bacterium]
MKRYFSNSGFLKPIRFSFFLLFIFFVLPERGKSQETIKTKNLMPDTWQDLGNGVNTGDSDLLKWWEIFNDTVLNYLIQQASENNNNILIALSRIDESRENYKIAQSSFYPGINGQMSLIPQKSSGNIGAGESYHNTIYSAGLGVSWEIDVFGRIRKYVKSMQAQYFASQIDYYAVKVALFSEIAISYINLRTYQKRLYVAQDNLKSQNETVDVTNARYKAGLVSELDIMQSKIVLAGTKASIPLLNSLILQEINNISILIGIYPNNIADKLHLGELPKLPDEVIINIPKEIIRQRPDIRYAEQQIISQMKMIGVSKSDLLPKFYLDGNFNYTSDNFSKMFNEKSMNYTIGPSLSVSLFGTGKARQKIKMEQARFDQLKLNYNQVVITAFKEVDNALIAFQKTKEIEIATEDAVEASQKSLDLSVELYKGGLIDFQNVLDAQRSLLTYEDMLAQIRGQVVQNLIRLYQSLGGGWDSSKQIK